MKQSIINVPVPLKTFLELVDFYKRKGSDRDPIEVINDAIQYWIENADWKEQALMPELSKEPDPTGYFWKSIFLPHGTKIRMRYKTRDYWAEIQNGQLVHEGFAMSPSEFANKVAGDTARNAWRDLWIKRPIDKSFKLADVLRQENQNADEQKLSA